MTVLEEPIKKVIQVKNYIAGEWVDSEGEMVDVVNPATGKVIAKTPISTRDEVEAAVKASDEAFAEWRNTPALARARCLHRLAQLMEEHFEELSRIQTMEHGKTIDESRGETRRGIENVEVAAGIPSLMMGYNLEDVSLGIDEFVMRQPLGVFGIIGPFNFPFMVPLWFAPYAIATGNCIIVKPSSEDPLSQMKIAEMAEEAGVPSGVWNVVNGGRDVVNGILDNNRIDGVCFVGSTPVGKNVIYRRCGETGKRVIAQCGAKNFIVITPDAHIEKTIAACMTSFFGNAGQRCLAGANLMVVGEGLDQHQSERFHDEVVNKFVAMASEMKVGYGLDESVQMGPLRDKDKKKRVVGFIEKGVQEGARLKLDGRNVEILGDFPHDSFLNPTIFDNVSPEMTIGKEEIFGPVASVMHSETLDEAIEVIHRSPFGNSAAIFTSNGKLAREFRHRVQCGNIGINVGLVAPMAFFPFSGMKDSFFGVLHGQGQEAVRFFTESKVVIERWF
jgi:malonate-semialdehyde dehydrogenase (acetylating)/methylmalonate-semialdehyde dehydrogenase